jgi:integrase
MPVPAASPRTSESHRITSASSLKTSPKRGCSSRRRDWAAKGLVKGAFPSKGLVYPKSDEKPPFMTWQELQRKAAAPGLSGQEKSELWDSLYLRKAEIGELLAYVKARAAHPWVYPLFCVAAHTGARRSELLRAVAGDVASTPAPS